MSVLSDANPSNAMPRAAQTARKYMKDDTIEIPSIESENNEESTLRKKLEKTIQ